MSATPNLRIVVMTTVPETLAAFFPRQIRSLAAAGFEVHVASSPGACLDEFNGLDGVTTHAIPIERQPHPWRDSSTLAKLYRLLRRLRPQIVHAHTPKAGLLGMAAARAAGVPIRLYTVHGLPLETRTGLMRRVLECAERSSAALSTRTYAISRSVKRRMLELRLCPARKLVTLGEGSCAGVDLDRFDASLDRHAVQVRIHRDLDLPASASLLTFVGRLSKDKGIGVLAEAWPLIAARAPHLHLLLAGMLDHTDPVPEASLTSLRSHSRVRFAGSLTHAAIPSYYAATDIAVLPTFREGLSQVSLEAGAMGVPIVASRATGLDAVLDGTTGLLVPPGDAVALADAIIALANRPDLRQSMGASARDHVRATYSAQQVNQMWMTEYRQLANSLPDSGLAPFTVEKRA